MKYGILSLLLLANVGYADTITNYITIVGNIPQMELKPDPQSQAWANSARQIIAATDETIAQTLIVMNAMSTKQGKPIFCIPNQTIITPAIMDDTIKKTYTYLTQSGTNTKEMPLSEVAMLGIIKLYPCKTV